MLGLQKKPQNIQKQSAQSEETQQVQETDADLTGMLELSGLGILVNHSYYPKRSHE